MDLIFHNNVFASLNCSFTTKAAGRKLEEESLIVFSNRGMSSGHASKASAQRVSKACNRKL